MPKLHIIECCRTRQHTERCPSQIVRILVECGTSTLLALAPHSVMLAYRSSAALLALAPHAVMLAYLRSAALLARALDAVVVADA
jgi:hypothetical protein